MANTLHFRVGRILAAVLDTLESDGAVDDKGDPHPLLQDIAPLYTAIAAGRAVRRVNPPEVSS
ncbi:hypothetical protein ABZS81_16660 [Streptomyces sp. NPDC005318]|uniref:hypothetical protein n=1 Tax=Streptomyces sp. NPDC005318 TaxID=3157031 RepID=UPI0033B1E585